METCCLSERERKGLVSLGLRQPRDQAWRELSTWVCLAQGLLLLSALKETLWQAFSSPLSVFSWVFFAFHF